MSKKYSIELAALVAYLREQHGDNIPAYGLVVGLAQICADFKPDFDVARFERACQPNHKPVAVPKLRPQGIAR